MKQTTRKIVILTLVALMVIITILPFAFLIFTE